MRHMHEPQVVTTQVIMFTGHYKAVWDALLLAFHLQCYLDIDMTGRQYSAGLLSRNWVSYSLLNDLVLSLTICILYWCILHSATTGAAEHIWPYCIFQHGIWGTHRGDGRGKLEFSWTGTKPELMSLRRHTPKSLFPLHGEISIKGDQINQPIFAQTLQPFRTPSHLSPLSQSVGIRTGQSISTAVSPQLSTNARALPLACLNTIIMELESKC